MISGRVLDYIIKPVPIEIPAGDAGVLDKSDMQVACGRAHSVFLTSTGGSIITMTVQFWFCVSCGILASVVQSWIHEFCFLVEPRLFSRQFICLLRCTLGDNFLFNYKLIMYSQFRLQWDHRDLAQCSL